MSATDPLTVHPLVTAIEDEFAAVRDLDAPLAERLGRVAARVRTESPEFAAEVNAFIGRLARAEAGQGAPQVGELLPGFLLADEQGRLTGLDELRGGGPLVVAFVRGHWCPYCRLNTIGLGEIEESLAPAKLVVISPERQEFSRRHKAESGARCPFLTDPGCGYALSLNLAIWVDPRMARLIASAGWDLPTYNGGDGWLLPVPSVFVLDRDGRIAARHVDPNYRSRMELGDIVDAVRRLG